MQLIENITISLIIALLAGFPLSVYAGVIVARYYAFENALNQARSIILNLEQEWVFAHLSKKVQDPNEPTGERSIYASKELSSNTVFWQLMQVGLVLKEQGHWSAASVVDEIAMEIDGIREVIIERAEFAINETTFEATAHIADWHRKLSKAHVTTWILFKPYPNKRYRHMSCVSINEETGEWCEEEPEKI